jgi:membrane protein implicated in regulation of membrane protease activity
MRNTWSRKRVVLAACTSLVAAAIGYDFFQTSVTNWSWPVSILLAACWVAVWVLVFRRPQRSAEETAKQEEHHDQEEHV